MIKEEKQSNHAKITDNIKDLGELGLDLNNMSYEEIQAIDHAFYDVKYKKRDFKYHTYSDPSFIKAVISKYSIKQNSKLLDLGCGTGWYSYLFLKNGLKVTGVDISASAIQKAREQYGTQINWIIGDACNLGFNGDFDIIYCCNFSPLNYVKSLQSIKAREIGKAILKYLRNGGLFIFAWPSNLSETRTHSTWMSYSLTQINDYFVNLGCGKIVDFHTTHSQLFPLMGKIALSKITTKLTLKGLKLHRRNVKIVCVIIRSSDN